MPKIGIFLLIKHLSISLLFSQQLCLIKKIKNQTEDVHKTTFGKTEQVAHDYNSCWCAG